MITIQPPTIEIIPGNGEYGYVTRNIVITNPNAFGRMHYTITVKDASTPTAVLEKYAATTDSNVTSYTVFPALYFNVAALYIDVSAYVYLGDNVLFKTVAEVCESTKSKKLNGVATLQKPLPFMYLKAFCNMPGEAFEDTYVYWESSTDGVTWEEYDLQASDNIDTDVVPRVSCSVLDHKYTPEGDLVEDEPTYILRTAWKLAPQSCLDETRLRPDLVRVPASSLNSVDNTLYRVKMLTVREVSADDTEYVSGAAVTEKTILGSMMYTPIFSASAEFLESDIVNASESKSLYHGAVLYAFGNPKFKNNLIASYAGESVRPLSKLTPLEISENTYLTVLTPWKNYLIGFTEKTIHLISTASTGLTASTVNTFIGIPEQDAKCCIPTLNGVMFKSGPKLYLIYPNVYAGSDSVLNLTDLSTKVGAYLEAYEPLEDVPPFAIGTDLEYILMLPQQNCTRCLRYRYSTKIWTTYEYPVVFTSYEMVNVSDIRLFGYAMLDAKRVYGEYILDGKYEALFDNVPENVVYADVMRPVSNLNSWTTMLSNGTLLPIPFELDSGQKTDSVSQTKQFVETKFNVTTLHEKDCFPMRVTIHIDGHPSIITREVYADSAFWKDSAVQPGTLATTFTANDSDIFNVFRQMFLRYSGKGKSIRHILEGESVYPFKIYDISYRYRNLNIKQ